MTTAKKGSAYKLPSGSGLSKAEKTKNGSALTQRAAGNAGKKPVPSIVKQRQYKEKYGNMRVCTSCYEVGKAVTVTPGHIAIEIILWCLFGVGIFYSVSRHFFAKKNCCPVCRQQAMIPATSRRGVEIITNGN